MPTIYFETDVHYEPYELIDMMHDDEIVEMKKLCDEYLTGTKEKYSPQELSFKEKCDKLASRYHQLSNEEIEMIEKIVSKL